MRRERKNENGLGRDEFDEIFMGTVEDALYLGRKEKGMFLL